MGDDARLIILGSVMGSGMNAATSITVSLTLLRQLLRSGVSLQTAVRRFSSLLRRRNHRTEKVELFACLLNLQSGALEYACVGMPHAWLCRYDGILQPLQQSDNRRLGGPDCNIQVYKETLYQGDVILAYTTGVLELPNEFGQQLGQERMTDFLSRTYQLNDLGQKISLMLQRFRQADALPADATVLTARLQPGSAELDPEKRAAAVRAAAAVSYADMVLNSTSAVAAVSGQASAAAAAAALQSAPQPQEELAASLDALAAGPHAVGRRAGSASKGGQAAGAGVSEDAVLSGRKGILPDPIERLSTEHELSALMSRQQLQQGRLQSQDLKTQALQQEDLPSGPLFSGQQAVGEKEELSLQEEQAAEAAVAAFTSRNAEAAAINLSASLLRADGSAGTAASAAAAAAVNRHHDEVKKQQ